MVYFDVLARYIMSRHKIQKAEKKIDVKLKAGKENEIGESGP